MTKTLLMILGLAFSTVAQGQMISGSASVVCSDCNRSKQGRSFDSMAGMVFNGTWQGDQLTAIHYFLPFARGQFTSPTFEFGEENVQVEIFPNPVNHTLFIRSNETITENYSLEIYDGFGRKMISRNGNHQGNLTQLDVAALPVGHYVVTMRSGKNFASEIIQIVH